MNIGIIIQARMGSTRLPGKVLLNIDNTPLIMFIYSRLQALSHKYNLVVATSTNDNEQKLIELCEANNISVFRGNEHDVLDRYYKLSKRNKFDLIVRVNADCPFLDADFVDDKIIRFLSSAEKYDYGSTILSATYPIGMHVEIFTFEALESCNQLCCDQMLREHVTPFIYQNPEKYKLQSYKHSRNLSKLRLTIDYEEDILFTNKLIQILKQENKKFNMDDIEDILEKHEELRRLNQHLYKHQIIN